MSSLRRWPLPRRPPPLFARATARIGEIAALTGEIAVRMPLSGCREAQREHLRGALRGDGAIVGEFLDHGPEVIDGGARYQALGAAAAERADTQLELRGSTLTDTSGGASARLRAPAETSASATSSASEMRSVEKCARAASTQSTRGSTLRASAVGASASPVVVASSSAATSGGSKPFRTSCRASWRSGWRTPCEPRFRRPRPL